MTCVWCVSAQAFAFCGMYVSSSDEVLLNDATQVVVLRKGTLTGITMQNDYKGPARDFAMIVPVPEVIKAEHVSVIEPAQFNSLIDYTVPRLVEYDRLHTCRTSVLLSGKGERRDKDQDVKVEAEFSVSEYDLVVLSAKTSSELLKWLERGKYNLPEGGEEVLQGYINAGMYFFVAKVDPERLTFDEQGHTTLTPLHFSYHSEEFSLPIRLGLLNAEGPQDLVVHVISDGGRVEAANYTTGIMPTNLIVKDRVLKAFSSFYEALFTSSLAAQKASLMTEHVGVWPRPQTPKCDPCTSPQKVLPTDLLVSFGSDELRETSSQLDVTTQLHTQGSDDMGKAQAERYFREAIWACYRESFDRDGKDSVSLNIDAYFERSKKSKTLWVLESWKTTDKFALSKVERCMERLILSISAERIPRAITRLELSATVSIQPVIDSSKIAPQTYTVTRLHGRFDKDSAGEDIVFRHAKALVGGFGSPDSKTGAMKSFYEVIQDKSSQANRYQARYLVLHPETSSLDDLKCGGRTSFSYWGYDSEAGAKRAQRHYGEKKPKFTPRNVDKAIVNARRAGLEL
jgi:hypothetical protein